MTTKPKAKKFRIRRSGSLSGNQRPTVETTPNAPQAAPTSAPETAPRTGVVETPREQHTAADIDSIKREGLTGRQLRMARRVAQKHGLAPTSDFDSVRLLRERGIDPFQRSNMLELVVPAEGGAGGGDGEGPAAATGAPQPEMRMQLPQTLPQPNLPAFPTEVSPAERRMEEVAKIQRDIAKRRRKKLSLLFTRLAAFVVLPTLLAGWYFYAVATPMFATKSEFVIQQAEGSSAGGLGGLLPAQFNTNQDSISVQSYLESRDAMLRLDEELEFKSHFQQPEIDAIQRLEADATNEDAYKIYKKRVQLGYDPTEGVVRMEVVAADPQTSQKFAERLIEYAEERVDNLTKRKREDQLREARETLEKAMVDRRAAQEALVALQQDAAIVDPEARIASLRQQISQREVELQEKELQLQALLDNRRPNQSRVDGVRGDVQRLEALLIELRSRMNDATIGADSLASTSSKIRLAQSDLEMQNIMLQSALQNLESSQIEANRQTRYLSRSVDPVAPDKATYPRAFENTVLAFLIFSGIYLMLSLTASVLREQVSS